MSTMSFVGVCMSGPGGADFPKVFQSGYEKLSVTGLPAQTQNTLVKGATYEVVYEQDQIIVTKGETGTSFHVKKAEATKL